MTGNARITPKNRSAFSYFLTQQTRWSDNDVYGHVNNSVYYHLVDSIVNRYLMEKGFLNITNSDVIGLVVETRCAYFAPLEFPQPIDTGLRVTRIGKTSVTYEIGLFGPDERSTAALASFTHVYVDRDSRRPVELPGELRRIAVELQD